MTVAPHLLLTQHHEPRRGSDRGQQYLASGPEPGPKLGAGKQATPKYGWSSKRQCSGCVFNPSGGPPDY